MDLSTLPDNNIFLVMFGVLYGIACSLCSVNIADRYGLIERLPVDWMLIRRKREVWKVLTWFIAAACLLIWLSVHFITSPILELFYQIYRIFKRLVIWWKALPI